MIKLLSIIALITPSFAYALSPIALPLVMTVAVNDKNETMSESIKRITELPPLENIEVQVFAESIAGPVKSFESNSCLKTVEYLKPRISEKPQLIMDGGYTVYINKKFVLQSSNDTLYSWMNRCISLSNIKNLK